MIRPFHQEERLPKSLKSTSQKTIEGHVRSQRLTSIGLVKS